ncbi:SAM-dependent methyltransferase [Lysinibacillus yapensis]|uniref:SAM-dependent methyltransferase n=1 Tax=Ureibacillus yapensis TaxID=2304605 RepID=A0A396SDN4_9BACL|nr:methyltransferase domain-containing protein [Lysinibacillus yapensis]RHW39803.1 SAM-dependent methyltransferase [Lysinibacillus yapensis]
MQNSVKDQWNAKAYDTNHSFVSRYGADLVELLSLQENEKILDVGCGTGDLANQLKDSGAVVTGIDQSANMIEQAISKYPAIKFEVKDATELDYAEEFDAVFSNATLHWVKPPEKALQCIYKSLKSGGRFVAEFGGKGNVEIITNEIINQIKKAGYIFSDENYPWFYPSIGQYTPLMEQAGFRVVYAQHFDRPTELKGADGLRNWIHMFANQLFTGIDAATKESLISKVEQSLRSSMYHNGSWFADYKRIRVVGVKEHK